MKTNNGWKQSKAGGIAAACRKLGDWAASVFAPLSARTVVTYTDGVNGNRWTRRGAGAPRVTAARGERVSVGRVVVAVVLVVCAVCAVSVMLGCDTGTGSVEGTEENAEAERDGVPSGNISFGMGDGKVTITLSNSDGGNAYWSYSIRFYAGAMGGTPLSTASGNGSFSSGAVLHKEASLPATWGQVSCTGTIRWPNTEQPTSKSFAAGFHRYNSIGIMPMEY